ncbi:S1 family peptidase [Paenibacillus tarimensis]
MVTLLMVSLFGYESFAQRGENYRDVQDNTPPPSVPEWAKVQKKYSPNIERAIKDVFGTRENFNEVGVFRFKQDHFVFGFDRTNANIEKFKNIVRSEIPSNLLTIEQVQYTGQELKDKKKEVSEYLHQIGVFETDASLSVITDYDNETFELKITNISDQHKQLLKAKYGDFLTINVDPSHKIEPLIERTRSYNNLGAGIALRLPEFDNYTTNENDKVYCSTAAIASKDNRWFIVTAGHCIEYSDPSAYQYDHVVGVDHHDRGAPYDFGLIKITDASNLSYGRYATNDLYEFAEDDDYYDAELNGNGWFATGEAVCKSGVRTGTTCGTVEDVWTNYTMDGEEYWGAYITSNTVFAGGGDSGGAVYSANDYTVDGLISAGIQSGGNYAYVARMNEVVNYYSEPDKPFIIKGDNPRVKVAD